MHVLVEWNEEKNEQLKKERGVCFEDVENIVTSGQYLDILPHKNPEKYPNQRIFVIKLEDYIYYVPFVHDKEEGEIFLKTIVPSRKLKAKY